MAVKLVALESQGLLCCLMSSLLLMLFTFFSMMLLLLIRLKELNTSSTTGHCTMPYPSVSDAPMVAVLFLSDIIHHVQSLGHISGKVASCQRY